MSRTRLKLSKQYWVNSYDDLIADNTEIDDIDCFEVNGLSGLVHRVAVNVEDYYEDGEDMHYGVSINQHLVNNYNNYINYNSDRVNKGSGNFIY